MSGDKKTIMIDGIVYNEITDTDPSYNNKIDYFNKQGWGYKEDKFVMDWEKDMIKLEGVNYVYSGKYQQSLKEYAEQEIGMQFTKECESFP